MLLIRQSFNELSISPPKIKHKFHQFRGICLISSSIHETVFGNNEKQPQYKHINYQSSAQYTPTAKQANILSRYSLIIKKTKSYHDRFGLFSNLHRVFLCQKSILSFLCLLLKRRDQFNWGKRNCGNTQSKYLPATILIL